jgi:hypothetical protein
LANGDNDETLRWFGNDGDAGSELPLSCRRNLDTGFGGGECLVVKGQYAYWPLVGLWGQSSNETYNQTTQITRCFACTGRVAPSLPSRDVVESIVALNAWDNGYHVNATKSSFVQAMAGYRFDDIPYDWPLSIIDNSQMISRVSNWGW